MTSGSKASPHIIAASVAMVMIAAGLWLIVLQPRFSWSSLSQIDIGIIGIELGGTILIVDVLINRMVAREREEARRRLLTSLEEDRRARARTPLRMTWRLGDQVLGMFDRRFRRLVEPDPEHESVAMSNLSIVRPRQDATFSDSFLELSEEFINLSNEIHQKAEPPHLVAVQLIGSNDGEELDEAFRFTELSLMSLSPALETAKADGTEPNPTKLLDRILDFRNGWAVRVWITRQLYDEIDSGKMVKVDDI